MRKPRLKPEGMAMFYHLYNRVSGEPDFLPFGMAEKERFVQMLHQLNEFFVVRVVAYQVMSNHFHLVVQVPKDPPPPEEVCRRYHAYYRGRRRLDPASPRCLEIGERMRDISWYMHALQQRFTRWYNRTRPSSRRGGLWADRFKHTLLGDERAVWECCKYVETNAVRAGIVSDPGEYRFCSYGAWAGQGYHPFDANVRTVLLPALAGLYRFGNTSALREALRQSFTESLGLKDSAGKPSSDFTTCVHRRVRYWVDGLVIGSELFVRDMVACSRGVLRVSARGLAHARAPDQNPIPIFCYKVLAAG